MQQFLSAARHAAKFHAGFRKKELQCDSARNRWLRRRGTLPPLPYCSRGSESSAQSLPKICPGRAFRTGSSTWPPCPQALPLFRRFRSEERRVGKECRSRWSRYHSKKNERLRRRRDPDRLAQCPPADAARVRGVTVEGGGGGAVRPRAGDRASLFFFSSRRRHTSLTCDWSSDVCSSD